MKKLLMYTAAFLLVSLMGCDSIQSNYKVSGRVLYNTTVDTPLQGFTVGITTNPYGPSPVVYTTVTDANGFYELTIPEGTYFMYADTDSAWLGVHSNDVTILRRYINNWVPNGITGDPLKVKSADINLDDVIDDADILALQLRIARLPSPTWALPDWIFENPQITVSADTYIILRGMCSGDFSGSYPNH